MTERGKDTADKILWMTRLSSKGDIYKVIYEVTQGGQEGKPFELTAPVYHARDNYYMIVREHRKRNGDKILIPIWARLEAAEVPMAEGFKAVESEDILGKNRKFRGTKKIGLGH